MSENIHIILIRNDKTEFYFVDYSLNVYYKGNLICRVLILIRVTDKEKIPLIANRLLKYFQYPEPITIKVDYRFCFNRNDYYLLTYLDLKKVKKAILENKKYVDNFINKFLEPKNE